MKIKSVCTTKVMVSKLKKLLTEQEKIYTSDKGLITRIHRELKN
jgi:predicted AAA+ superfamily ATPase